MIDDDAARKFSVELHGGLAAGASVAGAFGQGCAAISLEGLRDADKPQLDSRVGVDPEGVILRAAVKRAGSAHPPRVVTPAA